MAELTVRRGIDWGSLAPLRLRAKALADGIYSGLHRSVRRGAGIEFGGFREYSLGDDLRWLDRRAMLRHERMVIRQFETDTDRSIHLLVDATASMAYRGDRSLGSKYAYAAVIAAAVARIGLKSGDSTSLTLMGGAPGIRVPRSSGRDQFERIVSALELAAPSGDAIENPEIMRREVDAIARTSRRGSLVVVLSDLLDVPQVVVESLYALAAGGRLLAVTNVLDPDELTFPFQGPLRLRAMEGNAVVETEGDVARSAYLQRLEELLGGAARSVRARGGRFLRASTAVDPGETVRAIVLAVQ